MKSSIIKDIYCSIVRNIIDSIVLFLKENGSIVLLFYCSIVLDDNGLLFYCPII